MVLKQMSNHFERALRSFEEGSQTTKEKELESAPKVPPAIWELLELYKLTIQPNKIQKILNQVEEGSLVGTDLVLFFYYQACLQSLPPNNDCSKALAQLAECSEKTLKNLKDDNNLLLWFELLRSDILVQMGRYEEAQENLSSLFPFHSSCLLPDLFLEHFLALKMFGTILLNQGKVQEALNNYFNAFHSTRTASNPLLRAWLMYDIANALVDRGLFRDALAYAEGALYSAKVVGLKGVEANVLNLNGICFVSLGVHEKALSSFEEVLAINRLLGDQKSIAASLTNIANIHFTLGNLSKALQYYTEVLPVFVELNHVLALGVVYNNIGSIYIEQMRLNEALHTHKKALQYREKLGNPKQLAYSYVNIATIHYFQKNYSKALDYFQKALTLRKEVGDTLLLARTLVQIARVELDQGKLSSNSEALVDYPKPPYESDLVLTYQTMIEGLFAAAKREWRIAIELFGEVLQMRGLDLSDQTISHEEIIKACLGLWKETADQESLRKVEQTLQSYENFCKEKQLVGYLCRVYLLRAKLEMSRLNFHVSRQLLIQCQILSEENGFILHQQMAQAEIEQLNKFEDAIEEETSTHQQGEYMEEDIFSYLADLNRLISSYEEF